MTASLCVLPRIPNVVTFYLAACKCVNEPLFGGIRAKSKTNRADLSTGSRFGRAGRRTVSSRDTSPRADGRLVPTYPILSHPATVRSSERW